MVIVTLYQPPNFDGPVHLYVTPGVALDLNILTAAATTFGEKFSYVISPQLARARGELGEAGSRRYVKIEPDEKGTAQVDLSGQRRSWTSPLLSKRNEPVIEIQASGGRREFDFLDIGSSSFLCSLEAE